MQTISTHLHTLVKSLPILALCAYFSGCEEASEARFTIVATTSMIGDAVQNIVQDRAHVITLMGPGVDPHAYQATQRDMRRLRQADLIFYNGLHLEGKMADVLHKLRQQKKVYAASDPLDSAQILTDPDFPAGVDPHFWFDISLWQQAVQYMSQQLQAADPEAAADYQANTAQYLQKLEALHQETKVALQQIPAEQRVLITSHDAFGYLGRAYDLEVRGLQGISTIAESGLQDIISLVKFIIQRQLKAVFPETSVPDKPLKAVVEGCQKKGHPVVIGGYLYSDALGEADTPEGTYHGMMQANVNTIVNALQ